MLLTALIVLMSVGVVSASTQDLTILTSKAELQKELNNWQGSQAQLHDSLQNGCEAIWMTGSSANTLTSLRYIEFPSNRHGGSTKFTCTYRYSYVVNDRTYTSYSRFFSGYYNLSNDVRIVDYCTQLSNGYIRCNPNTFGSWTWTGNMPFLKPTFPSMTTVVLDAHVAPSRDISKVVGITLIR